MKQTIEFLMQSDQMDIGVAVIDFKSTILLVNAKMKTWYSVAQGETFPGNTTLMSILVQALQEKKGCSGVPLQESLNGELRPMIAYVYPQQKNEWLILLADIQVFQEHVQSRSEKERMNTIGDMAAGTANAILNPLAVIKGTLQLLEKSLRDQVYFLDFPAHPLNQKVAAYFKLLDDSIKEIDGSLQRFLLFGKPSELKFVPISIIPFIHEWFPVLQSQALDKQIRLALEYPDRNGLVLGHPKSMCEALQAIIDNAFDVSPPGAVVSIRIDITETQVQFHVRDQGSGIPKELQSQVVMPFVTSKPDALGFGLSFSQFIIRNMGGTLEIDSSDRGTNIIIQLPIFKGTVQ